MVILKLFFVFFKIGFCAFGGAYSFLPLLEREVVTNYHWLSTEEFSSVLGAVKILPGAISIKYATYTGYKVSGLPGIIAANLGNFLPAAVLIFLVSKVYLKYNSIAQVKNALESVQLAVFAMLVVLAFQLVNFNHLWSVQGMAIASAAFILFLCFRIHPAFIIVGAGIVGAFLTRQT